jgi:uncharacterized protein YbjT (DUF2867 family)
VALQGSASAPNLERPLFLPLALIEGPVSRTLPPSPRAAGPILVTGATGYVGGRLVHALAEGGRTVRAMARKPAYLASRAPAGVEVVAGDVLAPETLDAALEAIDTAFYLIHSMGDARTFETLDRDGAAAFAAAARRAGVRRIIYLGGLGESDAALSAHLKSRQEVGAILGAAGVPVIELRASVVIGAGSLSFEMVRALVERLPVMIIPRWVRTLAQPIAIADVLRYLEAALDAPPEVAGIFEIGGADRVSYEGLMQEYARQRGLERWMIPVPMLSPRISALWLGLVTPVFARIGRKLVDGLRNPTFVRDHAAEETFGVHPIGVRAAIAAALAEEDHDAAASRWSDAVSSAGPAQPYAGVRFGSRIVDTRAIDVAVPPAAAFAPIRRIGGKNGWYYANALWRCRAALDLLLGGVGFRRGRPHADRLAAGDPVDFWRVESCVPGRSVRLQAEMKVPGRAWLEFEVEPLPNGGSRIHQTAIFDPLGLSGRLYWYALYPVHVLIFAGMLRGIAARAEAGAGPGVQPGASSADRPGAAGAA